MTGMLRDYQQTIDFLYARLPVFSRIGPAAYKADLHNTIALCNAVGNPHHQFKSIHIAGTNGKGSVSHMLAAIMQEAGYKTGLYTSPHLKDFGERFRINGQMIDPQWVTDFVEKIKPLFDSIEPSFFEITVVMAYAWFAEQKVDIAVIETGLGGRLDSTNIISPELAIITNIGWDHSNLLGDSLEKIAAEKAGIIKKNIPVVIGEVLPETLPVFERVAKEKSAPLLLAPQMRQVTDWRWQHHLLTIEVGDLHHADHRTYQLDLPGLYQTKNLLTVLEACSQLRQKNWILPETVVHNALQHVKKLTGLAGRWEQIGHQPDIILDVAHNEPGIMAVLQQVEMMNYHQLHIVFGVVKDKEPENLVKLLPPTACYYFTQAQIPRALPAHELKLLAASHNLIGKAFENVNLALREAREKAQPQDLIVVCGSIFVIAEVNTV